MVEHKQPLKDRETKAWYIRTAGRDDVPAINRVVNHYIQTSGANWAWHDRSDEEAYAWFDSHTDVKHPIFVAEVDGQVAGYASLSAFRSKDGYWPVAENSLYLLPQYIGQGIGYALMEQLMDHARTSGLEIITAWIDSENTGSIQFHHKFGFHVVGEMKDIGEKFGQRRSVTIMQCNVQDDDPIPVTQ